MAYRFFSVLLSCVASLIALSAPVRAQGLPVRTLPTPTETMNWAELTYPQFFPSRQQNQTSPPYLYRYYPESGNYLGIDGETVAVIGPISGGQLQVVGRLTDFACQISPVHCAPVGGSRLLAGNGFSLAIKADGTVLKWGSRLTTDGVSVPNSVAVKVSDLSGIATITGNDELGAVFALATDGTLRSWGRNDYGALGIPSRVVDRLNVPTPNPTIGRVRDVAIAGTTHRLLTIFLREDGTVGFTPRADFFGTQVAVGTVPNLSGVAGLSDSHADNSFPGTKVHAIKSDGTVWKLNWSEARIGGKLEYQLAAQQVNGLSSIVQVACGTGHCLARDISGSVWAWGEEGALGNGTIGGRTIPFKVSGVPTAKKVTVGHGSSYVVTTAGALYGWGKMDLDGAPYTNSSDTVVSPILIVASSYKVVDVSPSGPPIEHVLFLLADGSVWTWGNNFYGQLGDGTTTSARTIVRVLGVNLSQ